MLVLSPLEGESESRDSVDISSSLSKGTNLSEKNHRAPPAMLPTVPHLASPRQGAVRELTIMIYLAYEAIVKYLSGRLWRHVSHFNDPLVDVEVRFA